MKRSDELKVLLNNAKAKAGKLEKVDEINAALDEIKNLKAQIEIAEMNEADDLADVEDKIENKTGGKLEVIDTDKAENKTNITAIKALIKKRLGYDLTKAENSLLVGGSNGEGYILPQEIITIITKLTRSYKSIASVLGYMPATALSGSLAVENFESVSELVDMSDGTEIDDISDISFKNITYSLKEKAGFIGLSNTLLTMTDNDLIAYVADVFARKYAMTQNKMGLIALKNGKTVKAIDDWKALKKSINKDLSEAVKSNLVILTNQDGFNTLDEALDGENRPILQPNPSDPTKKTFLGYPIEVFDNSLVPTVSGKAPIVYGALKDAVKFVGNGKYMFDTDKSVGFKKNITVARIITYIDCVQIDSSDKAYVYGQLTIQ